LRFGIFWQFGHTKNWCNRRDNPICRDCAAPVHTGMCLSPKKCVNCNPPDDNHGSYDRDCQVCVAEMAVITIKTDLGISYELARKKFEEQFDRKKETYVKVMGRNEYQIQKEQEIEVAAIKERQRNTKKMTKKIERENEKLKL
jgi:hypothetical protein